jgi:AcrR family transcriptional regulator
MSEASVLEAPGGEQAGKREKSKAANRQAILEAARRVFTELGYEAATVRDIIRGTDLASGTFYNYFKSKEEVFEALSDDGARRFRPILKAACESAVTFEGFIRGAIEAYFQFLSHEHTNGPGGHGPTHVDTPEMRAVFDEVRSHIDRAIAAGLAPKIDTEYFTAASIGLAREVGARMVARAPHDVRTASAFCANLILGGLPALSPKS